jgi:uncharacterized tellurite resistance protein B-like protein
VFTKLKALFTETDQPSDSKQQEERIRLACAALMTEVATIDQNFDEKEQTTLLEIISTQFSLNEDDAKEIKRLAEQERHDATSLHQFTRLVNEHCSREEKYELVCNMWKIAYADGHLDKYEEYIIRRASELIYLDHSDFIRAKVSVKNAAP